MAVTECHIGCTREEQMRWLHEVWQAGVSARRDGIDVRAITTWALLGSYDWNSLVTCETDHYEPGAFDVRGPVPRATALAGMVRALATDGRCEHPVLATPGWWRRGAPSAASQPVLIIAQSSTAGHAFVEACDARGLASVFRHSEELDLESPAEVERILNDIRPWAVIGAVGLSDCFTEACERNGQACEIGFAQSMDANATLDALLDQRCGYAESRALSASIP
jgi:dTDP-4-dehydrorhamnose reductase